MSASLLDLRDVRVKLGDRLVLENVSLSLHAGDLTILAGPNGAGKTTLLRTAAGLCAVSSGTVRLAVEDRSSNQKVSQARAYLEQGGRIHWPMRVRDVVGLGRLPFGHALGRQTPQDEMAIGAAIRDCGLDGLEDMPTDRLSGGETARVLFARALAVQAPVLLVDEPIASLDPAAQIVTMHLLEREARRGCAVLAVMHDLPLAFRFADRVVLMQNGRIAADGSPADLVRDHAIDRVFGLNYRSEGSGRDLILSPSIVDLPRH